MLWHQSSHGLGETLVLTVDPIQRVCRECVSSSCKTSDFNKGQRRGNEPHDAESVMQPTVSQQGRARCPQLTCKVIDDGKWMQRPSWLREGQCKVAEPVRRPAADVIVSGGSGCGRLVAFGGCLVWFIRASVFTLTAEKQCLKTIEMSVAGADRAKRARVDRSGFQKIHCEKTAIPKPSDKTVLMAARMDYPHKKPPKPCTHGNASYFERLHDEACSSCRPPASAQEMFPTEWHHMPWDELEMKKHSLLDSKCHHFADAPLADEVEMKKQGMVDSEGHHASRQLDERERKLAAMAAARSHEKLEAAKRNPNLLLSNLKQPHIKISHDVQVCQSDEEEREESEESEKEILTARGSMSDQESRSPVSIPSGTPIPCTMPVSTRGGMRPDTKGEVNIQPIVLTKAYETENGQFELSFNIQVLVKPKPKGTKDEQNE